MISVSRKKLIICLADRIKEEYAKIDTSALTDIAMKYGDVKAIVKTPLIGDDSCLVNDENDNWYIFHWPTLPFCERFNIAHETGHAILHKDMPDNTRTLKKAFQYEFEADLFATKLCGIPRFMPYLYQYALSLFASYGTRFLNIFRKSSEKKRLEKLGIYHVLEYQKLV